MTDYTGASLLASSNYDDAAAMEGYADASFGAAGTSQQRIRQERLAGLDLGEVEDMEAKLLAKQAAMEAEKEAIKQRAEDKEKQDVVDLHYRLWGVAMMTGTLPAVVLSLFNIVAGNLIIHIGSTSCVQPLDKMMRYAIVQGYLWVFLVGWCYVGPIPFQSLHKARNYFSFLCFLGFVWGIVLCIFTAMSLPCGDTAPALMSIATFNVFCWIYGLFCCIYHLWRITSTQKGHVRDVASAHREVADNEQRIKDEKERKEATEAAENKRKEKLKKIEDERRAIEEMKAKRAFNDS